MKYTYQAFYAGLKEGELQTLTADSPLAVLAILGDQLHGRAAISIEPSAMWPTYVIHADDDSKSFEFWPQVGGDVGEETPITKPSFTFKDDLATTLIDLAQRAQALKALRNSVLNANQIVIRAGGTGCSDYNLNPDDTQIFQIIQAALLQAVESLDAALRNELLQASQ